MPTHRVPRGTLHEDLLDIERVQCERVMSVVVDPDDTAFYIIETTVGNGVEMREVAL